MSKHISKTLRNIFDLILVTIPFDSPKDRPNLGYIKGETFELAVDAGHSSSHVEDFYKELEANDLPLPDMTVITHWHWDHTFGMHAVHGHTLALPKPRCQALERKYKQVYRIFRVPGTNV